MRLTETQSRDRQNDDAAILDYGSTAFYRRIIYVIYIINPRGPVYDTRARTHTHTCILRTRVCVCEYVIQIYITSVYTYNVHTRTRTSFDVVAPAPPPPPLPPAGPYSLRVGMSRIPCYVRARIYIRCARRISTESTSARDR